jgi:hypothetical protein
VGGHGRTGNVTGVASLGGSRSVSGSVWPVPVDEEVSLSVRSIYHCAMCMPMSLLRSRLRLSGRLVSRTMRVVLAMAGTACMWMEEEEQERIESED